MFRPIKLPIAFELETLDLDRQAVGGERGFLPAPLLLGDRHLEAQAALGQHAVTLDLLRPRALDRGKDLERELVLAKIHREVELLDPRAQPLTASAKKLRSSVEIGVGLDEELLAIELDELADLVDGRQVEGLELIDLARDRLERLVERKAARLAELWSERTSVLEKLDLRVQAFEDERGARISSDELGKVRERARAHDGRQGPVLERARRRSALDRRPSAKARRVDEQRERRTLSASGTERDLDRLGHLAARERPLGNIG